MFVTKDTRANLQYVRLIRLRFSILTPCRSWQLELEEARKVYNEYKAKVDEQLNLRRKLEREVREAKVNVTPHSQMGLHSH